MKTTLTESIEGALDCRKGSGWSIRSFFVLASLALALSIPAPHVTAQTWIPVGVPGGNVRDLVADPRDAKRLYLGTADGILYRSTNGGRNWERLDPGFPRRGCSLDEIVVDRRGVVTVGFWEVHGRGGGVARSHDGGETFEFLKGMEGHSVRALSLAPSNPRIVAAGTLEGVFLSRDGGATWKRISPENHPDIRNVGSLAIDPLDPRVIYAGTWHLPWKTEDGGGTWTRVHEGMIDDSDVMTLTVEPGNRQILYATACTGIYRSRDGGGRWTKLTGIPFSSRRTRAFALGHEDKGVLLAGTTQGLWISEDRGGTWRRSTKKQVINAVIAQPDGTILLGTEEDGVLRSKDSGRTWVASNTGFSERLVSKLLFDPLGGRVFMATWGARGGVYVSSNVGGPWKRLGDGLEGRQVLSLALLGERVLAGTDHGIFARGPEAESWSRWRIRIDGGEIEPRVTEIHTLPSGSLVAATSLGVIQSPDEGRTWKRPSFRAEEVLGLAVSDRSPDVIVAATKSGFYRSKNGGGTWKHVSKPLGVTPHALVFVPSHDRILFATTTGGLYRSKDQGGSWKRVGGGIPHSDLTGIVMHPDGRSIYVSDFTWGGIFRSADGGSTWLRMPVDGLGSDRVWSLIMDPARPNRLLASASAGGLHLFVPRTASRATGTASRATERTTVSTGIVSGSPGAAESELAPAADRR